MIKVTGSGYLLNHVESQTGRKIPVDGLYIFLFSSMTGPAQTSNEAGIGSTKDEAQNNGKFKLPSYTAEELTGGVGGNPYSQLVDKLEDLVITYLESFNPNLTFEKASIDNG